jgi:hypothetical protein
MNYDQIRADEEKAWRAYQDATADEDRRRVEAGRELTMLCAAWADLQRRRSGMSPLPPSSECPADHHWITTPSTPKTCPTCGKEL